jgi:hypothetical protein
MSWFRLDQKNVVVNSGFHFSESSECSVDILFFKVAYGLRERKWRCLVRHGENVVSQQREGGERISDGVSVGGSSYSRE